MPQFDFYSFYLQSYYFIFFFLLFYIFVIDFYATKFCSIFKIRNKIKKFKVLKTKSKLFHLFI